MTLPSLTPEQRAAALARAAEVRRARSEFKQSIKAKRLGLAQALEQADTNDMIAKVKVSELLSSLPGVGKVKAAALMEEFGIAETRRLRGLGAQQRELILSRLA